MSDKVQKALREREAKKRDEEQKEKYSFYKESRDRVDKALENRKTRIQSNVGSIASDIKERYNSAVDSYKSYISNNSSLASGTYSEGVNLKSVLDDQREGSLAVSKLIRDIEAYRSYLGDDIADKALEGLTGMSEGYKGILKNAESLSQFKTKDDYDKAVQGQKDYEALTTFDLEAGKAEIEGLLNGDEITALKAERDALNDNIRKYNRGVRTTYKTYDEVKTAKDRVAQLNQEISTIEEQARQKQAYWNRAKYTQDGIALTNDVLNAEDFEENSQYVSTKSDKWYGRLTSQYGMGYDDLTYEYINNIDGMRGKIHDEARSWNKDTNDYASTYEERGLDYLTPEEVKIYNYYYSTEGKEKAEEFLDSLQETLNYRKATTDFESIKGKTFQELIFGVEAGLDQFKSGVQNLFNTSNDYIVSSPTQMMSGMVREDLADDGFKILGNSIGQVGYDLINTTSNMLPSILTSTAIGVLNPTAGAAVGAGLMGTSAAGNAYAEMLNLGYDKGQARMYSALVGGSEALLQYALGGISKLGGKFTTKTLTKYINNIDNAFARVSIKLGKNMASEFTEEYLQEILNPLFKNMALGTNEEVNLFTADALYSGILGALSAGILEGRSTIAADVQTTKTGKKIQSVEGGVERLKNLGTTFSADTVAHQIADKVTAETGAYKLGLLLQEVGGTLSEQNVSDIIIELTKKGVSEADAKKLAKTYQAFLNKEMTLSNEQVEVLEGLDPLADVLRNSIIGKNTSIYQRTREYSDLYKLATEMESNAETSPAPQTEAPTQTVAPYSKEHFDSVVKEFEAMGMPAEHAKIMAEKKLSTPAETNTSPAEENVAESEFEVSAEGKTINTKTDKIVNIKNIESISESGEANLNLDDGMVVKASDLTYGSDAEALFVENIGKIKLGNRNISTTTANALYQAAMTALKANPNMTASEATSLIKGLEESYVYGAYNFSRSELSARNEDGTAVMFAGELSQSQRSFAYELGSQDKVSEVERDQKVIDELKTKGKPSNKSLGKIIFEKGAEVDESTLTATQKANLNGIKLLADISSVEFHIFKSEKVGNTFKYTMPDGTVNSANGWFVAGSNQIWVDLNAGNFGEGAMIRTAAHEISHYIKQWSPVKWKAMADLLMAEFAKNGVDTESMLNRQIAKIKRRYSKENMPSEAKLLDMAYEELVSDALSDMLTDGSIVNFITEVKAKDQSLAKKIMDAIKNLLKKWGLIIEDYKGRDLDTDEAKALSQLEDTFKKLQEMYQEAFMDANDTYSAIGNIEAQKNTTDKGDVRLQARELQRKDPTKLTESELIRLLEYVEDKTLSDDTYIPVRINTPQILITFAKEFGYTLESHPLAMRVYKARQALSNEENWDGDYKDKPHDLSPEDVIDIIKAMNNPSYLVFQTENERFAEIVKFQKKHSKEKAYAIIDFSDVDKNPDLMNGYKGGKYNILVTVYPSDDATELKQYLSNKSHKVITGQQIKKKDKSQGSYGGNAPSLLNDLPFFNDSITQPDENIKKNDVKNSDKDIESKSNVEVKLSDRDYLNAVEKGDMETAQRLIDEAAAKAGYTADYEWRINHKAPNSQSDSASSLDKIQDVYGNDIYSPQAVYYYGEGREYDQKAITVIKKARNNPNAKIKIYRAVPTNVKDTRIRNGDWVAVTREYADEHGYRWIDGNYRVIENTVPAKHLFNNGDSIQEFGYDNSNANELYKNTENNVKLATVTYDDNGKVIPLSKRFNAEKKDIRYSDRDRNYSYNSLSPSDYYKNGKIYSYDFLVAQADMSMVELPKTGTLANEKGKIDDSKVISLAIKNALSEGTKKGDKVYVKNAYTGRELRVDNSTIKHGLDGTYNRHITNARIGSVIGTVVKNAIPINGLKNTTTNAVGTYAMVSYCYDNLNREFIAVITVEQHSGDIDSFELYDVAHAVSGRQKKSSQVDTKSQGVNPIKAATISISNLLQIVNSTHQSILSEDVLKHLGEQRNSKGSYFDKVLFSDRDTEDVSNRSLLVNALSGAAKNADEKQRLLEYKSNIRMLDAEQDKLQNLNKQIKELSFSKGARDAKKLDELKKQAKATANRINYYDKKLLELESVKAIKNVLSREKKKAVDRQKQKDAEYLKQYKERVANEQKEIVARYQESRKKAIEGREKTAMRHKIQKVVSELNQLLLRGTKDKHVMIGLQKVVAEALDAVNMDTVGAEERVAHYNDLITKAKDPDVIASLTETRDRIQQQGDKMSDKLTKLKNAYNDIKNSDDPLIANSYDEVIASRLEYITEKVGNTPLRNMSLEQLEDVYDMYKMVLTTIRNSNKAFKNAKKESIATLGNRVMVEVEEVGGKKKLRIKGTEGIEKFAWNNLKPVYAMSRIGSDTLTEVFNNVRAGEDTWAVDVTEAREYYLEQSKKHNYDSWDFKKRYKFTSTSGMDFELSLEQIMSLYAYSKREQAAEHLRKGGIVFDETTEVTIKNKLGIPMKFNPTEATAYNLSVETLADIVGKLTNEQRAFVDEMQSYLSDVMGEKGNEVSLVMYGVKLFKEKFYFPLKSATQFMAKAKEQQMGEVKIKNSGFSKETVQKASNPIVLTPFMDVWSNHVNEMSMYHAFVLPMEDFYRVFNYKTPTSDTMATESVEMFIQNAYGKGATQYIEQLLKDLNGGAVTDPRETFSKALMSKFKKAAVMASLSVVVQQPTAMIRAMSLVSMKHFGIAPITRGIVRTIIPKRHKTLWAEVKKYAPVAIIKEMGRFDTNMGRSVQDYIKSEEYKGLGKVKGFFTNSEYRDDVFSRLPALADEMAWVAIWEAVKRETVSQHKSLKPNSDEFLKIVGERFTEVITKTQVYDSVLSRSANMRAKSTFMNMWTSFMAEPTTSINMLEDALRQGKRGNKRYTAKVMGAVYGSIILNAALVSVVYAMRDDDEDETFVEKYVSRLSTELLDGINPITYIPFLKDVWSIAQGFDVERADMSLVADLVDTLQQTITVISKNTDDMDEDELAERQKEVAGALWGIADSISSLVGLPVKNVRRDINGAINLFDTLTKDAEGRKTTAGSLLDEMWEDVKSSIPVVGWLPNETKQDKLYDAIVNGDTAYVDRLKSGYKDDKAYESAVRLALRENDSRIKEAAQSRIDGDIAEYTRIVKAIKAEGNFVQDTIVAAVNAEINALNKGEDSTSDSDKTKSMYKIDDYFMALNGGDEASAYVVKEDLINTDVANGKDREEAEESFNGKFTSYIREQYEEGGISDYEAQRMLVNYGDKTEDEASSKVQHWAFKQEYPDYDDLSEEAVSKYYEKVEPYGITLGVYYDYSKQRSKCKGTDNNGDGKTDNGSVKAEVLWVIDSLPLTYAQKDALYYLNGWSAKTIYEAPWH